MIRELQYEHATWIDERMFDDGQGLYRCSPLEAGLNPDWRVLFWYLLYIGRRGARLPTTNYRRLG